MGIKVTVKCKCFHHPPIRLDPIVTSQIYHILKKTDVDPNAELMDWKCPRCKSVVPLRVKDLSLSST